MLFKTLLFDVQEHVATVTLNRPGVANAIDVQTSRELLHASIRCDEDPEIRAIVLTGSGRFFSAGGDVKSFGTAGRDLPYMLKDITAALHGAITRFRHMDAPVVTAVNGMAAGAGFGLACAGDFVLCSESASFTQAYSKLGLSPDGGASHWLPRLVGHRRAAELMLSNRTLSAEEAVDWGLANGVVPADALGEEALTLARELAEGPTAAHGVIKRLLETSAESSLSAQLEREAEGIAACSRTDDGQEGVTAFLEKRPPVFRGS